MIRLQRVVMEVFGGCNYTCQMCPHSNPGRGTNFTRKMPLKEFERILDELTPKYGAPQINLDFKNRWFEHGATFVFYKFIDYLKFKNIPYLRAYLRYKISKLISIN